MLDLSFLKGRAGAGAAPAPAEAELDDAYACYVAETRARDPRAVPMSEAEFER